MLSEPVGPRSPDDILAVVYQRTERVRRRHRQQLTAAVAVVALGVAGLVSLVPGDDEAARVRVVDGRNGRTEEVSDDSATPTAASTAEQPASTPTTVASPKRSSQPSNGGGGDNNNKSSTPTAPPLPTTTLPTTAANGPNVRLLAEEADRSNDSLPTNWYYDITHTAMQLDLRNDIVVFTTRYRTPDTSGTRDRRVLRNEFDYENAIVTVDVTEESNALGQVVLGGGECDGCTADFDDTQARLTVTIPVSTIDAYLVAHHGQGASIEQAVVSTLDAITTRIGVNEVSADKSGDGQ
jgi:hypothetical protein